MPAPGAVVDVRRPFDDSIRIVVRRWQGNGAVAMEQRLQEMNVCEIVAEGAEPLVQADARQFAERHCLLYVRQLAIADLAEEISRNPEPAVAMRPAFTQVGETDRGQ